MMKRISRDIISGAVTSIPLILFGVLVSYVVLNDKETLDLTLFILGAIPIVLFLPGVFSKSASGALHTPKVIFRKVDTLEKKDISNQENTADDSKFVTPFSLVTAGVITWLVGVIV